MMKVTAWRKQKYDKGKQESEEGEAQSMKRMEENEYVDRAKKKSLHMNHILSCRIGSIYSKQPFPH